MTKIGKHRYLDEILETEEQIQQIKNTIYDVHINIFNIINRVICVEGRKEMPAMLWKKHIPNAIEELSELKNKNSGCAFHDSLDEKIARQIKYLRCLLKILEKLELDFIFI